MHTIQDIFTYVPDFGTPHALAQQNERLAELFNRGTILPEDATVALDRFWQAYRTPANLTCAELRKLAWCFATQHRGRRILDNKDATLALLNAFQPRFRASYLCGLRHSFFQGYRPGNPTFELFRASLHQILDRHRCLGDEADERLPFVELLTTESHFAVARHIISQNVQFREIGRRFALPADSAFFLRVCGALVDAVISLRHIPDKLDELFDFLTQVGDMNVVKYAVRQLLAYYQQGDGIGIDRKLANFALTHLGDPRTDEAPDWVGIGRSTQDVFTRWLTMIDIEAFFDKIAEDGERKAFWLEYLDSLEYTRIVVGEAFHKKQKRYATLMEADDENAIILRLGDLIVVEFGNAQTPRYLYDLQAQPFVFDADTYERDELRQHSAYFKQVSKPGWQLELANLLHTDFGIYRHQSRRRYQTGWRAPSEQTRLRRAAA